MSGIRAVSVPTAEPVSVNDASDFLKIARGQEDGLIGGLITSARIYAEAFTNRSLVSKDYEMTLDSFPYYTDTVASQQAFPPSYYSLPRISTSLWNYSQLIKLWYAPVTEVKSITYIGTDAEPHTLYPGIDFIVDYVNEPCRIFTVPGSYWPPCYYVANAVSILYTAGFDPDPAKVLEIGATDNGTLSPPTLPDPPKQQASYKLFVGVPQNIRTAILMLVSHWYYNREPVAAGSIGTVPYHVDALLSTSQVLDWSPTRG